MQPLAVHCMHDSTEQCQLARAPELLIYVKGPSCHSTAPHLQAAPQYIAIQQAVQHHTCRQPLSTLQYIKQYSTAPAGSPSVHCSTSSTTAPRLQAAPQYSAVHQAVQHRACRQPLSTVQYCSASPAGSIRQQALPGRPPRPPPRLCPHHRQVRERVEERAQQGLPGVLGGGVRQEGCVGGAGAQQAGGAGEGGRVCGGNHLQGGGGGGVWGVTLGLRDRVEGARTGRDGA